MTAFRPDELRRIDLRGTTNPDLSILPRAELSVESAIDTVRPICDDVRQRGATAVREITARFDGVDVPSTRVPAEALSEALAALDTSVRDALTESIRRARLVHEAQRRDDFTVSVAAGATVTERWIPVDRVGLYVPGGLTVYPSSVVMNAVPAQVAGVRSLAIASPPQKGTGLPHPTVLAACALLGVDEVHAVGGAQAVAAFAYGTDDINPVDLVTGPGNVFVAAAKRLLKGVIGIDSEAGPTEIAILADATADAEHVAADLLSQAEHDPRASALLVTDSEDLSQQVAEAVSRQTETAVNSERILAALRGQSAVVLVDSIEAGLDVVNAWAPEHLEVITKDAEEVATRVRSAGAIFIGPYTPVSLGDYLAGSNHVLPTGGTARHSSGLSVQSFLKGIHVVKYDRHALAEVSDHISAIGGAENLHAHVAAVTVRVAGGAA
ncbi:histidinol dehydrogenase [Brevibacterium sanguinis]|uniref:Histidinol dehydrogenase n=2 Tax=Brevibacterium TaxID=1696 RepID=A0A366IPM2_9MICO|nr:MULTISPECIES: histidinol dehydrogenase [Brevibacterium]RBP67794.1 histidinol dehydrogenase [Brevibacterium sanguinis]RBP74789.1 histidinol dehydrogenase [Brevibacterium celere]